MPKSKADLLSDIGELAEKHSLVLPDEHTKLSYVQLDELLKELQSKAPADPPAPAPNAVTPPADPPAPSKELPPPVQGVETELGGKPAAGASLYRYPYTVAQGHAVKASAVGSSKGQIPAFRQIRAIDLQRGQQELDELVASGAVVAKRRPVAPAGDGAPPAPAAP